MAQEENLTLQEKSEYNVILTFANKLLSENIHIDMEIQNIIDEHFWDIL